jgi:hypothetical protein
MFVLAIFLVKRIKINIYQKYSTRKCLPGTNTLPYFVTVSRTNKKVLNVESRHQCYTTFFLIDDAKEN